MPEDNGNITFGTSLFGFNRKQVLDIIDKMVADNQSTKHLLNEACEKRDAAASECESLHQQLEQLQEDDGKLQKEFDGYKAIAEAKDQNSRDKISELQASLEASEHELQGAKASEASALNDAAGYKAAGEALEQQLAQAKAAAEETESRLTKQAREAAEQAEAEKANLQAEMEAQKAAYSQTIEQAGQRASELSTQLQEQQAENASLTQKLLKEREDNAALQEDVARLTTELSEERTARQQADAHCVRMLTQLHQWEENNAAAKAEPQAAAAPSGLSTQSIEECIEDVRRQLAEARQKLDDVVEHWQQLSAAQVEAEVQKPQEKQAEPEKEPKAVSAVEPPAQGPAAVPKAVKTAASAGTRAKAAAVHHRVSAHSQSRTLQQRLLDSINALMR